MTIQNLLARKDKKIYSIRKEASLCDAIQSLAMHNTGALLVLDDRGELIGIISERDIVRKAKQGCGSLDALRVNDVMTKDLIIGFPEDDISYVMAVMTKNHIRHLPVMSKKELVGILSIGDVVEAQLSNAQFENHLLNDYITGKYPC